ncbi:hypothetical protein T484DRAFT_1806936 [Baffinella frigidus]|nr:hypothetical protein T484DRAFT_1806936 [Cryptophyta sp. CCMP2293]
MFLMVPCNCVVAALYLMRPTMAPAGGSAQHASWDNCILLTLGIALIIASSVLLLARASSFGARMNLDAVLSGSVFTSILILPLWRDDGFGVVDTFSNSDVVLPQVLPYLGITFLGAAFGRWYTLGIARRGDTRERWLVPLLLSIAFLVAFVALRLSNAWGNTYPVSMQVEAGVPFFIAFFDLTKYPPSLAFFAYTLGTNLGLYAFIVMYDTFSKDRISSEGRVSSVLLVFAASALGFYIMHHFFIVGVMLPWILLFDTPLFLSSIENKFFTSAMAV